MKDKVFYLKIIIVILIILNAVSFKIFYNEDDVDLCFYEKDSEYVLIEKNVIKKGFTSYLYKNSNDHYLGKIYEYGSNKELNIEDLIKEDKINEYYNKIKELLSLKYPKFIVEELIKENVTKSYLLRDNELIIFYNGYDITPTLNETLFLKVNYNEIKDYINFTVILDSDYDNENGYVYTNSKKSVAFTFDDSPNKGKTNKILEYLHDNLSHATFFVLGDKMKNNEDLIISIKNFGNEIGSHTYNHQNMNKMSDSEVLEDYELMNNMYKNIFNEDLKYLRPPYGNIKKSQLNLLDLSIILWSLDTNDWRYRNSDYLVNYVVDNIKDGDIILFHDSYDSTVDTINKLLPILYSKGYQVMSVSELFALKGIDLEKNKIYHKAS